MNHEQRTAIVAEARTWLGTPFVHAARLKGVGVDCAGVVIGVANALGISEFDVTDYTPQPDEARMQRIMHEHLHPIAFKSLGLGDILWLRTGRRQHLAIVVSMAPVAFIHAWQRGGADQVVETRLDEFWQKRIAGCFRYRGLI